MRIGKVCSSGGVVWNGPTLRDPSQCARIKAHYCNTLRRRQPQSISLYKFVPNMPNKLQAHHHTHSRIGTTYGVGERGVSSEERA